MDMARTTLCMGDKWKIKCGNRKFYIKKRMTSHIKYETSEPYS